jgi:hypothetical protein
MADFNYEKFRRVVDYESATPTRIVYTLTRGCVTTIGEEKGSIRGGSGLGDPWIKLHWPMCDIIVANDCADILWAFGDVPIDGDPRNSLKNAHGGVNVYVY